MLRIWESRNVVTLVKPCFKTVPARKEMKLDVIQAVPKRGGFLISHYGNSGELPCMHKRWAKMYAILITIRHRKRTIERDWMTGFTGCRRMAQEHRTAQNGSERHGMGQTELL